VPKRVGVSGPLVPAVSLAGTALSLSVTSTPIPTAGGASCASSRRRVFRRGEVVRGGLAGNPARISDLGYYGISRTPIREVEDGALQPQRSLSRHVREQGNWLYDNERRDPAQ
jgi:hypothetical protein